MPISPLPDFDRADRYEEMRRQVEKNNGEKYMMAMMPTGIFQIIIHLFGFEDFMCQIAGNTDEFSRFTSNLTDLAIRCIHRIADAGADGIILIEDMGLQDRMMISPAMWHDIYAPLYTRMFNAAHQRGLDVISHTCGHIVSILDDYIACGLDTRCYRMSGYAHWYNLDLPETMAVREKLLPESGTISQIAMSAMEDWGSKISEQNVPVLIVIEGLTMYLNAKDVQQIFAVISSRFSQATIFVETMNPAMVRHFKEKSIDASNAKFTWGIKNGKALAELLPGFRFMEEHSLTEGMAVFAPIYKLLDKLPTVRNISNKIIVLEKEL